MLNEEFYDTLYRVQSHINNKLNLKSLKNHEIQMMKLLYIVGKNKSIVSIDEQIEKAYQEQNGVKHEELLKFATDENVYGLRSMIRMI